MRPVTLDRGPSSWKRLRGNRQFVWLFLGNMTLFFGFAATILLRSLLAWRLTGDEMSLAWISLVSAACALSSSVVSGAIVDRFERRRLMLIAQSFVFATEAAILVLYLTGKLTFPLLLASVVAASVTFPFIMPARTAMVVDAVGRPVLGKANALMSGGVNVARMISPALVGVLAEFAGIAWGYGFLLLLHLISQVCTLRLVPNRPHADREAGLLRDVVEGFRYVGRHNALGVCIFFGMLPTLIVIPLQSLLVVFVDEIWGKGGGGLGIMMGAMGIGGLAGSVLLALSREGSLVKPLMFATLSLALFLLAFGHSPWFGLATVMLMGVFICSVYTQTLVHTAVQLMTDDRMRGRTTTVTMMSIGLTPLGTVPLAFAAKHLGAPTALTIATALLVLAVAWIWYRFPSFHLIDEAAATHQADVTVPAAAPAPDVH